MESIPFFIKNGCDLKNLGPSVHSKTNSKLHLFIET